ncbi:hypothetical protein DTW90_09235 [Neorhizobium sp. P12A]|nr:hypothetical protein DTW90_09235 [Neorhizobium sp. P12A]
MDERASGLRALPPPHPPAGTFSPAGEKKLVAMLRLALNSEIRMARERYPLVPSGKRWRQPDERAIGAPLK